MGRLFGRAGFRHGAIVMAFAVVTMIGTTAIAGRRGPSHVLTPNYNEVESETAGIRQVPRSALYLVAAGFNTDGNGCVSFVNLSPREAKRIRFLFSGSQADGKDIEDHVYSVSGSFATNRYVTGQCGSTGDLWETYKPTGSTLHQIPVAGVVTPIEVDYTDGTSWSAGPDVLGRVVGSTNSDITITRAFAWAGVGECVDFVTRGNRIVDHVQFVFSHLRFDGTNAGDDPLDVRESSKPGETTVAACRTFSGQIRPRLGSEPDGASPEILVNAQQTTLAAYVRRVDYDDGGYWNAPRVSVPTPLPTISPAIRYDTWWPATSQFPIAFESDPESTIDISNAYAWANDGQTVCVNYITRSPAPTGRIWFRASYIDNGEYIDALVDDEWSSRGGYARGTPHKSCWSPQTALIKNVAPAVLPGVAEVSQPIEFIRADLTIVYPVQWADGSLPVQFTYGQHRVSMCVSVDRVDFTDGTSWRSAGAVGVTKPACTTRALDLRPGLLP
jgi:hypothetical protein